jgi:hypothetical protein
MTFAQLQRRLIDAVRARLRNGEITERGFARRLGFSQPHIHNVLKGVRILTPRIADRMLAELGLTVFDLAEPTELKAATERLWMADMNLYAVPIVHGRLGPGEEWPDWNRMRNWINVRRDDLEGVQEPLGVALGSHPELEVEILPGSLVIFDHGNAARRQLEAGAWYLLRRGRGGVLAQATKRGKTYLVGGMEAPKARSQHLAAVWGRVLWIGEDPCLAGSLRACGRYFAPRPPSGSY